MTKHFEFIINHWQLWLALGVILSLLIYEELKDKIHGISSINPQTAALMLNHENSIVIDLRKTEKYNKGHILGSINLSITDNQTLLEKLTQYKEQSIILVDENESFASNIGAKLKKNGFNNISTLAGGINAWSSANLPLVKTHKN